MVLVGDIADLIDLLDTRHFEVGLRLGLVALAGGWVLSLVLGRKRHPLPIGGLLIATATVGGLALAEEPLDSVVPALALILVGALAGRVPAAPRWVQPLAVVPGAAWFAFGAVVTELAWVRILAVVLIPLGGLLISEFESRHDRMGLGVVFFTLAVMGMFAAVPDTENALVLMMVAVPIALLSWPVATASLGPEGGYLALAIFLWVTAAGGGGRPPSIIGSVACLGLLLAEPILVRLDPALPGLKTWLVGSAVGPVLASVPQFVLVVICSRVAARFTSEAPAILVVVVAYGAFVLWVRRSRLRVPR